MSLLQSPAVETQINDQQKGGQSAKEEERVGLASKVQEFLKKGGKVKKVASSTGRKRIQKPKKDSIAKKAKGNASGGAQTAWASLPSIKAGTRLEWVGKKQPSKKVHAEVFNVGSMQCYLFVDGVKIKNVKKPYGLDGQTFDGVVAMEAYVRAKLCGDTAMQAKIADAIKGGNSSKFVNKRKGTFTTKICEGWDVWAVKHGKKGTKTVHELYNK